jgi:nucleotide-binding universal stress UspA family protein
MTNRIVVGVDGSAHSDEGLRWALSSAERLGDTEVVAVFAWGLPLIEFPGAFDKDEIEAGAKRFLQETARRVAPEPRVPLKLVVAHGDPASSLIEASQGASLLVVGTRGRNPFKGLLLGSVAQGCAADADCPVVIVKLRQAASGDGAGGGALEAALTDDR